MPVSAQWRRDDHPPLHPPRQSDADGYPRQATAQEAAERGWYYRRAWYLPLEPDTRRDVNTGKVTFDALALTKNEAAIRNPISPNILLHEEPLPDSGSSPSGGTTLPSSDLLPSTDLFPDAP